MKQISHYRAEDPPIGEGGMGLIYKATGADGNVVAIKEILPEFAEDIEMRFRINQEMRFLERLDHPSVVKTYESFMLADQYYIVMELVNGKNIEHYVAENGVMSEQEAIELMIQILEVMDYVHQQGIVHRDIKPSNIMVQPDGQIKVLDFGIAKDMNSNGHTQVGAVIGSDGYMSPEQADGMAIDHRSDIYSLGCVLFYMVTGHHAYPPQSSEAQMLMSLEKPFPRIKQYNSSISKKFQNVLDTATDKNMLRRYGTCLAFKQALLQIKQPGGASTQTHISKDQQYNQPCIVTLGRMGCDFHMNDSEDRVSRHHASIEYKVFTGGSFYIFRDDSANGSLVNNNMVHHMAYHIPCEGPLPEILLAGSPECKVDWEAVADELKRRYDESQKIPEVPVQTPEAPTGDAPEKPSKAPIIKKVALIAALMTVIILISYAIWYWTDLIFVSVGVGVALTTALILWIINMKK